MIDHRNNEEMMNQLYKAFLSLKDKQQCKAFLNDLCTFKEIEQMAQRLEAAKLLSEGHTYTQVSEKFEISSATISRVSKCVKYSDGYTTVLENLNNENN